MNTLDMIANLNSANKNNDLPNADDGCGAGPENIGVPESTRKDGNGISGGIGAKSGNGDGRPEGDDDGRPE